jgi:hypothetical protein
MSSGNSPNNNQHLDMWKINIQSTLTAIRTYIRPLRMVPLGRRGCVPSYFELEAIKEEIARYKSENDLS